MTRFYTIRVGDIGAKFLKLPTSIGTKRVVPLDSFLGYVQKCDVGKRIYLTGGIYQVESIEQMKKRISKTVTIVQGEWKL